MSEERKRISVILWLASVCAVVLLISAWSLTAEKKAAEAKRTQLQADYASALACLSQQEYEDAASYFSNTPGYEDTDTLILYANAEAAYDAENAETYQVAYEYCTAVSADYNGPYAEQLLSLKKDVGARKAAFEAEQDKLAAEQAKNDEQQYRTYLRQRLPYVGMREVYIDSTFLGYHGDIAHNYEMESGKQYLCTLYRWYINGGKTCIFVARTLRGEVISASKWNESTAWNGDTILGTIGGAPSRSTTKPKSTAKPKSATKPRSTPKPDPYNSSDYSHPEDFYYDYYDDFWDYEDAEDYWNEYN